MLIDGQEWLCATDAVKRIFPELEGATQIRNKANFLLLLARKGLISKRQEPGKINPTYLHLQEIEDYLRTTLPVTPPVVASVGGRQ